MVPNAQMWVAISVPSVLALIGILFNVKGVADLSHRFDRMEDRMGRIEDRLLDLLVDHESRLSKIEARVDPK